MIEIQKNIQIIDLGLYLKKEKTLIITDLHIGYEESLNKQGVLIPRFSFKDLVIRLNKILNKTKPETIIINGDIKHEFGKISETEWRNTLKLLNLLAQTSKVILIKGNHDKILKPIAEKKNITIKDSITLNNILIIHGNKIPKDLKQVKTIIIGHEHPAISISDSTRKEKYKCFLKGKYKRKNLIVQPSFNLITEGTDISKVLENQKFSESRKPKGFSMQKLISPFLKQDLSKFNVYIVSDKVYDFGKLKDLVN
jgi:uncharacterized protein